MHIKFTEVELSVKGEMMLVAKKELKQELKKLAESWKDQVKIIPDDELAKFVKRDTSWWNCVRKEWKQRSMSSEVDHHKWASQAMLKT